MTRCKRKIGKNQPRPTVRSHIAFRVLILPMSDWQLPELPAVGLSSLRRPTNNQSLKKKKHDIQNHSQFRIPPKFELYRCSNYMSNLWAKNIILLFLVFPFYLSVHPSAADVQLTVGESWWDLLVHSFLLLWLSWSACLLCFPTQPSRKKRRYPSQHETKIRHIRRCKDNKIELTGVVGRGRQASWRAPLPLWRQKKHVRVLQCGGNLYLLSSTAPDIKSGTSKRCWAKEDFNMQQNTLTYLPFEQILTF